MPRPSKKAAEEKAKAAAIQAPTMVVPPIVAGIPPPNVGNGPRTVDNDAFLRVRDSVSSFLFSCIFHRHGKS